MSEVHNTIIPVEAPAATEPAFATPAETPSALQTEEIAVPETTTTTAEPLHTEAAPIGGGSLAPETTATGEPTTATEETAVAEPSNAVDSGVLGYKAPGLIKSLKFSKKHFWFGEEPVSTKHLSSYLRGEKPDVAHPTAAWSSQTGKGLLFFAKQAEEKASPAGVLNLSEASDLEKQSPHEFSFKLHGGKHTFKAANDIERDGWFVALEKAIPEAKASKEGIVGTDGYKESMTHLGKPAALAGGAAAGTAAASNRKSVDAPRVEEPTRATSSDSDDAAAAKKSKSRSVSRNKRTSIFGKLLEKKDEHEIKKDIKKEEKAEVKEEKKEEKAEAKQEKKEEKAEAKEEKKEEKLAGTKGESAAVVAPLDAEAIASRVHDAPLDTTEPTLATDATTAPVVEKADKPRPTKRNSLFGSFFEKVRSPATEKKESEVGPIVPPKDTIVSAEAPQIPEPTTETTIESPAPVEPVIDAPATTLPVTESQTETPVASSTLTPRKEKESFFGGMMNKVRAKSPANVNRSAKTEEAPAVPPKTEESVIAPTTVEPAVASTTAEESTTVEPIAAATTTTEEPVVDTTNRPKESRRRSFFGGLSTKAEGMFRRPSQAQHTKKEENIAPASLEKTEEQVATEPTANEEAITDAPASETAAVETEQHHSIGDVPGEAITVGHAQSSNPTVSAAA